jgi:hypothetical protein
VVGNTGIGTSLVLIAVGAILAFAVDYEVTGIDVQTIGGILMVVGIISFLLAWLFLSSFSPIEQRRTITYSDRHIHEEPSAPPSHTQVNINPPPPRPENTTEVNVNQPPTEPSSEERR